MIRNPLFYALFGLDALNRANDWERLPLPDGAEEDDPTLVTWGEPWPRNVGYPKLCVGAPYTPKPYTPKDEA